MDERRRGEPTEQPSGEQGGARDTPEHAPAEPAEGSSADATLDELPPLPGVWRGGATREAEPPSVPASQAAEAPTAQPLPPSEPSESVDVGAALPAHIEAHEPELATGDRPEGEPDAPLEAGAPVSAPDYADPTELPGVWHRRGDPEPVQDALAEPAPIEEPAETVEVVEVDDPIARLPVSVAKAWRIGMRMVPWISLALSVAGAVWMKRDESSAARVAVAVAGSWLAMSGLLWLRRRQLDDKPRLLMRAADFAGIAAAQSLAQLPLFFSAPFYALAFAWTPPQVAFAVLFAMVVVIVTWDPLAERLLPDRWFGPPLLAFGSFVGLRVALSMLGLNALWALLLSVVAVAVSFVWDLRLRWRDTTKLERRTATGVVTGALLLLAPTMPAAPMRLVEAGIGTGVESRRLVGQAETFEAGTRLWCWTAILAPRQNQEKLIHRWVRNKKKVVDLELDVTGGREQGFRTWTRLRAGQPGTYRCEVRTRVGQVLGYETAVVR